MTDYKGNKILINGLMKDISGLINGTDWNILFPSPTVTATYVEVHALLINAMKKLGKIHNTFTEEDKNGQG